jgi:hypothetical protein
MLKSPPKIEPVPDKWPNTRFYRLSQERKYRPLNRRKFDDTFTIDINEYLPEVTKNWCTIELQKLGYGYTM